MADGTARALGIAALFVLLLGTLVYLLVTRAGRESAGQLESVFASLPTNLITKHEVVELSVGFVAIGLLLAGSGLLLGRAWRPLP